MVGTLLALKGSIPKNSKEQARMLVQRLVDEIMASMEHDLKRAVTGALNRKQHSPIPSLPNMDWKRTVNRNLKNYDMSRKQLIPDKFYFFENQRISKEWNIILDLDQSGSMADSIIYASIMGLWKIWPRGRRRSGLRRLTWGQISGNAGRAGKSQ